MTSTSRYRPLAAALLVLALAATACSGNSIENVDGSRFCQVLNSFPAENENVSPAQAADAVQALYEALPETAPNDVRAPLAAMVEMADIAQTADSSNPSAEDRARATEAMAVLDDSNLDFFDGWLTSTCPTVAAARGGAGLLGESPSSSTVDSAARAPAAVATAVPEPTATPAPTPTPTPIPVVSNIITDGGHTESFRARQMSIESVTLTNGTYATFVGDEDVATDQQRVIVEMFTQSEDFDGRMERDNFRLESPEGRTIAADEMFLPNGSTTFSVNLETRDSADFVLGFVLPDPVENLDGWFMYYGAASFQNASFPLVGTRESPYPLRLDPPAGPVTFVGTDAEFNFCADLFDVVLRSAVLDVEGLADDLLRAPLDSRYLTLEMEFANIADEETDDCTSRRDLSIRGYEWRVLADGVPRGYDSNNYTFASLEPGERVEAILRFEIPAETSTLELVDEQGNPIATWQVDLAATVGEAGYDAS